ncbi:MAG: flippase-like domain-containing protein [Candidatus Altiarchaeales archaeon]|nr:flippase-like domain-containing protein [Candidatus Altiarchaeales archaeon]MBD3417208.1 flippase-like domain-containing protein [Candidatus Altiarchaeales archaeon]
MFRKRILLFVVSILLLGALFFSVDYNELFRITSKLSYEWTAALIALQLFIMLLMSLKWYVIIRRYAVSFTNVLHTSIIGFMVNSLTPVSLAGGEPVRAYVISKIDKIKMEKSFATVLVDLYLHIIPVLFLNLVAIFIVFKYSMDLRFAWLLGLLAVLASTLLVGSFSLLTSRDPSLRLFNAILDVFERIVFLRKYVRRVEAHVDDLFSSFHRSIRTTMTDVWTLTVGLIISIAIWALSVLRIYLVFLALGVPIELWKVIVVYAILVTVSGLPLLPGALGIWEWVGTGLFTVLGLPLEVSAAIVLVDRLLFFWLPIFTGFLSSLHIGLNVTRLVDRQD